MKILFPLVTFCFFLMPSTAYACSCLTGDAPAVFNSAKVVFVGRMLGGTEKFSVATHDGQTLNLEAGTVRFSIDERFKGEVSRETTIFIDSMRGTSCGDYGLKRGETYLVYAYEDKENKSRKLYTGVCTRTSPVAADYVTEDLKFLRSLPPAGSGGNIAGRIWVDTKEVVGGGAAPLEGIEVNIRGPKGQVTKVTTDKAGEFRVNKVKAGKYRIEPVLPKHLSDDDDPEEIEVEDLGTATAGIEVYYSGSVAGRAVDSMGVGYNSLFLHLRSTADGENQKEIYGHSDGENGSFSFDGVPPGEYIMFLKLQHEDSEKNRAYYYPGTYDRKKAAVIEVGQGEAADQLLFKLPAEYMVRTIEGQVVLADGKPAAEAEVLLLCPQNVDPNGYTIEFTPTSASTDKDGRFLIQGFANESYSLTVRAHADEKAVGSQPRKLALSENLRDIKIVLSEKGHLGCDE